MAGETARVGERLRAARERLGLTQQEVAQRMGLNNYQTLLKIEQGAREPRVSELSQLAEIYYRDFDYFLYGAGDDNVLKGVAWRKEFPQADTSAVEVRLDTMLSDYALLEEVLSDHQVTSFGEFRLEAPSPSFEQVALHAEKMISCLNLGAKPAQAIQQAIESKLGIKLLHMDMGNNVSAVTATLSDGYAIVINTREAPWRRNFSLAHELYHILRAVTVPLKPIHSESQGTHDMEETLANVFASALLMPASSIEQIMSKHSKPARIGMLDIVAYAREFEVSADAFLWRLVNLKYLKKQTRDEIVSSDEFKEEYAVSRSGQNAPALEYSLRFVKLALRAFRQSKISKGKLCSILKIRRQEVASFIEGYGFTGDFDDEQWIAVDHPGC